MTIKSAKDVVRVKLPEYLLLWLSDCAERDYRTIEQQIVFLLAGCMERHESEVKIPTEGAKPDAGLANTSAKCVPVPVAPEPRYPVLAAPPAEVKTIRLMGDLTNAMGPAFGISGTGSVFRIEDGLWDDNVSRAFTVYSGKQLAVYGQADGYLYLK